MDYRQLIREAWATTWQHRFLWVLGLFAGAAVSTCSGVGNQAQYRMPPGPFPTGGIGAVPPEMMAAAAALEAWLLGNLAIVLVGAVLLFLVGLVVSIIAQGGITEATVDLARHRPTSLGRAWTFGRHLFWRFLGLALVPFALAIGLGFVFAAGTGLAVLTSTLLSGGARMALIGFWVLLAVAAILATVAFAIALSIALAYAQRIVVVENVGFVAAVREGWGVMRSHLSSSLLTWLINVALGIGAQVAVGVAIAVVAAVLVAIGFVIYSLAGFTAVTGIYVALGATVAIALLLGMEAIVNTFFWSYWTLVYLRLTGTRVETP